MKTITTILTILVIAVGCTGTDQGTTPQAVVYYNCGYQWWPSVYVHDSTLAWCEGDTFVREYANEVTVYVGGATKGDKILKLENAEIRPWVTNGALSIYSNNVVVSNSFYNGGFASYRINKPYSTSSNEYYWNYNGIPNVRVYITNK